MLKLLVLNHFLTELVVSVPQDHHLPLISQNGFQFSHVTLEGTELSENYQLHAPLSFHGMKMKVTRLFSISLF